MSKTPQQFGHLDFAALERRIRSTYRSRYKAADRLNLHNRYSQWTVALVSVGLILEAIWEPFGLPIDVPRSLIDVTQVFFAALMVAFSLLLTIENFTVRAREMFSCGLQMHDLLQKLQALEDEQCTQRNYSRICTDFSRILGLYDNHSDIDYMRYKIDQWRAERPWEAKDLEEQEKLKLRVGYYPRRYRDYLVAVFRTRLRYGLEFCPYLAILLAVIVTILWTLSFNVSA